MATRLGSRGVAALMVAVLGCGAALSAQDLSGLCGRVARFNVGQWSSYRMTGPHGTFASRFAIVGREGPALWYEVHSERTDQPDRKTTSTIQMLVTGLGTSQADVRTVVMKAGDRPAQRMPDMMRGMVNRMMSQNVADMVRKSCERAHAVGWESVRVPAGTFRALHVTDPETQANSWVLLDVPFGMVKMVTKDGIEMVLTGHGTNAKSLITETPTDMGGGRH
jgi:hypothetical protein